MGKKFTWTPLQDLAWGWAGVAASADGWTTTEILGNRLKRHFLGDRHVVVNGKLEIIGCVP